LTTLLGRCRRLHIASAFHASERARLGKTLLEVDWSAYIRTTKPLAFDPEQMFELAPRRTQRIQAFKHLHVWSTGGTSPAGRMNFSWPLVVLPGRLGNQGDRRLCSETKVAQWALVWVGLNGTASVAYWHALLSLTRSVS